MFAAGFGHDHICLKVLSVQNVFTAYSLITVTYMQHNLKDHFMSYLVYLNNYHTYAVFFLF